MVCVHGKVSVSAHVQEGACGLLGLMVKSYILELLPAIALHTSSHTALANWGFSRVALKLRCGKQIPFETPEICDASWHVVVFGANQIHPIRKLWKLHHMRPHQSEGLLQC